jgi:hypothetical protein
MSPVVKSTLRDLSIAFFVVGFSYWFYLQLYKYILYGGVTYLICYSTKMRAPPTKERPSTVVLVLTAQRGTPVQG